MATARVPSAVTLVSTAPAAPAGSGSAVKFHAEPFREVHAAGVFPAEPTATKPGPAAVTARTWRLPAAPACVWPPGTGSGARAQVLRSFEYQAAGAVVAPVRALPTTT